jgi:hypothetical protein
MNFNTNLICIAIILLSNNKMIPNYPIKGPPNSVTNPAFGFQKPLKKALTRMSEENPRKMSELSTQERLKTHVENLCKIPRNSLNHAGMKEAVDYIKHAWTEIGLGDRIEEQNFVADKFNPEQKQSKNIIVSLGPNDAERIIIGAHYDTCAQGDPSVISNPGADDNASAVAGLLETGRNLKSIESELFKKNIRIDLVAYANEEPPYYHSANMGSFIHARSLKANNAKVKGMICYEMIGFFDDKPDSQGYLDKAFEFFGGKLPWMLKPFNWLFKKIYPSEGNFLGIVSNWSSRSLAKKLQEGITKYGKIETKKLSIPSKLLPLIEMSDQWSYWKHDYPAVMITDTSFLRNPNYHKETDLPETLNYNKMSQIVNGVVESIMKI